MVLVEEIKKQLIAFLKINIKDISIICLFYLSDIVMDELDIRDFFRSLLLKWMHTQTITEAMPTELSIHKKREELEQIETINKYRVKKWLSEINLDKELKSFLQKLWQELNQVVLRLWDVTIVPWVCYIIGGLAMSDKKRFGDVRDIFEKWRSFIPGWKESYKLPDKLLWSWQFGGGIKFIYATVKYINTHHIEKIDGVYKVSFDSNFCKYFLESEQLFDFISKSTTEPSVDNGQYWRSNKSYAKKILSLSWCLSISDQTGRGDFFEIREN